MSLIRARPALAACVRARKTLAACIVAGLAACAEPGPTRGTVETGGAVPSAAPIEREVQSAAGARRDAAIDAMRGYLADAVQPDGWFVYARDGQGDALPGYNIVRHAGTMLAMSQALMERPDDTALRDALAAAARRLIDCCVGPVPFDRALAVWWPPRTASSAPSKAANDGDRLASLGAAALGLIALIGADRHGAEPVPVDTLRGLGRFLLAMQRGDGSFRSRWFADARDDDWRSLYYPGEAALALLWLARVDADPTLASQWSRGAIDALMALADERRGYEPALPDHWALIATGALACGESSLAPGEHDALTLHAWQIARGMAAEQGAVDPFTGGFVDDDRVTPTATRLEGLLALQAWPLPDEARWQLAATTGPGLDWLLASIPAEGPAAGAVPRHRDSDRGRAYARQAEVRIDYVQHALSALLMARRLKREADACPLLLPPDRPDSKKTERPPLAIRE